jgi:DNA-binding MarR family transcriptional regulator
MMPPANEDVLIFIRENPGCLCVDIARALETSPAHVSVELRVLRERGVIVSDGNTRGTRYTVTPPYAKRS